MHKESSQHVNHQHPWPGLAPYTDADRQWFHGRTRELEDLIRRVRQNSLTILFSRSGIGKTSLLRAGLLPRLRQEAYWPVYVRLEFSDAAPSLINQVWACLEREMPLAARYAMPTSGERPSLWEFFHDSEEGLLNPALNGITPVLVFDQFEEVFTLGERSAEQKRRVVELIDELADVAENRPSQALQQRFDHGEGSIERFEFEAMCCHLLIGLREDYLSNLERHRQRLPMLMQNRMPLNPLNGQQALDAVLAPARHLLDEVVAEQIVRFVGGATEQTLAESVIDPSLLNLICRELNVRRIAAGDEHLTTDLLGGSREEILDQFYDNCFAGLPDQTRAFIEEQLLTESGFRESITEERVQENIGAAAVSQLISQRLLSVEERGGARRVELAHDLLAEVTETRRDKRREAERIAAREREKAEAAEAAAAQRRELEADIRAAKVRQAKVLRVAAAMCFLALAAVVAAYYAWRKSQQANELAQYNHELSERNAAQSSEADFLLASEYQRHGRGDLALAHLGRALKANPRNFAAADSAIGLLLNPTTDVGWLPVVPPLTVDDSVRAASWSPDGRALLAVAGENVIVWPLKAGQQGLELGTAQELFHEASTHVGASLEDKVQGTIVRGAVWSPNSGTVATWSADFVIRLWNVATGQMVARLVGHTDTINSVRFSPDGNWLLSASYDHTARLWKRADGSTAGVMAAHKRCVNDAVFSPDGSQVVTVGDDGMARVWRIEASARASLLHECAVTTAPSVIQQVQWSASQDHPHLLLVGESGLSVRDWQTGASIEIPVADPALVRAASLSPDGHVLAVATPGRTALLPAFAGACDTPPSWPVANADESEQMAFSPEGRRLARWQGTSFRVWSTDTGEPCSKPITLTARITSIEWSPDARYLAVSSGSKVNIWDASDRVPAYVAVPDKARPTKSVQAALVANAKYVGTNFDAVARLWHVRSGEAAGREVRLSDGANVSAFSPTSPLFVVSEKGLIHRYNMQTGRLFGPPVESKGEIQAINFSVDGALFVTAATDFTARVWDSATGALVSTFTHPQDKGVALARFNREATHIAIVGYDNTAFLADAKTGQITAKRMEHEERINWLDVSSDSRLIVTASDDRTARVWDATTGDKKATLVHLEMVSRAIFSTDGKLVATLSRTGKQIDVWDWASQSKIGKPMLCSDEIKAYAFDATGARIVTGSSDMTAQLWDTVTGEPLGGQLLHVGKVLAVEFSPDGKQVLTASDDGRARVWETFALDRNRYAKGVPEWFPQLLDATTDQHLEGTSLHVRERPDRQTLRDVVSGFHLPQGTPSPADACDRLAWWLATNPEERGGTFASRDALATEVDDLLASTNSETIRRAFLRAAYLPMLQAALARTETRHSRGDFLLNRAVQFAPDDPEVAFQSAMALEKRRATETEEQAWQKKATALLMPHSANSHCLRGLGWLRARTEADRRAGADPKGSPEPSVENDVIRLFEQALKITPRDPVLLEYYGWALRSLDRPLEALKQWRQAIECSPPEVDLSDLRAGIAIALLNAGQKQEASDAFRLLRDSDPHRDWTLPSTVENLTGEWTSGEKSALRELLQQGNLTP